MVLPQPSKLMTGVRFSLPAPNNLISIIRAGIAQLVEQLICNHQVPSSNLGAGTIKPK